MSDHGHDNHDHQELVENSGVNAKPILIFLAALAVATAAVFVIIKGLQYGFKKVDEMDQKVPATQLADVQKLPPEPRLQGAPEPDPNKPGALRPSQLPLDDMKTYRERINAEAAEYNWVDKQGGIARLPIERAKELIVEKGLPALSDNAIKQIQAAEAVRREVYNSDSSAGRLIKSQAPTGTPQPAPTGGTTPQAAPAASATGANGEGQPAHAAGQAAGNEQPIRKAITPVKPVAPKQ